MRVSTKQIAGGVALAGVSAIATYTILRPRLLRWGATEAEATGPLPGDERVTGATYVTTRAVTIRARPAEIWPWLAQMGYRRGGLYSYDWLDRLFGYLDRPSAHEVLPEFQQLRAGDTIPLGRGPSWPVVVVEPERTLVLEPLGGVVTWSFVLVPIDAASTRLVTRVRFHIEPTVRERLMLAAVDPAAFVMTRKMLLGIKQRAEALYRSRSGPSRPGTCEPPSAPTSAADGRAPRPRCSAPA